MHVANGRTQDSELERELLCLLEASSLLLASPESQDVLNALLSLGERFIEAAAHAVWWKRPGDAVWDIVAMSGLSRSYRPTVADPDGSVNWLAQPIAVEDIDSTPAVASRRDQYRAEGIRSLLIVPLRVRGEVCGTIVFYYRTPHRFSETEKRIGTALGNLAASALSATELYAEQKRLREEAERSNQRTRLLAEAGEVISSSLDYEHTLRSIAERAVPFFADWCAVDVIENGEVRRVALKHLDPEKLDLAAQLAKRFPPRDDDAIRIAMRTGESVLMEEIPDQLIAERARDQEHAALIRSLGLKSIIIAPLTVHGRSLGCLSFATAESRRRYSRADLELAQEIAQRAAIAMDNATLHKEVLASKADLTRMLELESEARSTAELLNRVGPLLLTELDLNRLVQSVTDVATELTGAEFGSFFYNVIDEKGESYALYTLSGVPRAAFEKFPMPRNTAVFDPTFRGEGVVRSDDITQDPRYGQNAPFYGMPKGHLPVRSYLAASVVSRSGEVLGGLFFGHSTAGKFTARHETIVNGIAAQAAIAIDNARLFEATRRTERQLQAANQELRRANNDLEQFAYSASHDLKEPLRNVAIYSEMIARRSASADAAAQEYLGFIVSNARRMDALLNDLLAFTRAGAPFADGQSEMCDAAEALASATGNLATTIAELQAEVRHDSLPEVRIPRIHLEQLFQNLISNALKYRSSQPPRVRVAAQMQDGGWRFSVTDNGIGIEPEYQERIFGIFKRLHTSDEYPGTGIGLAICKRIVERYQGRIWVESEPGRGATFFFTVPV